MTELKPFPDSSSTSPHPAPPPPYTDLPNPSLTPHRAPNHLALVARTRPRHRMGESYKNEPKDVLFDGYSDDPKDALMDFGSVLAHPLSAPIDIQAYCTLVYRCTHFKSRGPYSDFYSSPRLESEIREGAKAALREKKSNRGFFLDEFPCPPGKPSTTTLWTWSQPRKSFMPRFAKSPLHLLDGVPKLFGSYHFILKSPKGFTRKEGASSSEQCDRSLGGMRLSIVNIIGGSSAWVLWT
ncbi:hypothetical protein L202_00896 [Cryptococcus amylolentus CBS 6039]|uniref:Uncharacterized protein n=2 Tax=Cryptococcus amylolentus TaxID=104669 RepID=A0A1E3I9A3_9TREE|nr:hypothetical protein L202_00896 [Cryptococcus amylolentus CBS 6039]ODN85068.1 hypothetical protein L202_00896 [Cryptococcus amylolentus CBS 6039]ODO11256.1 hypothetical protein I350_00031 [Cryptococcus amylolentus CBS 6273]